MSFLTDSDVHFNRARPLSEAISEIRSGSLRFPMGTLGDNYLWHTPGTYDDAPNGLTPRVASMDVMPGTKSWAVNGDGTFKTDMDFDEFISLCRATQTVPVVMVNARGHLHPNSTVTYEQLKQSAVEWVRYANVTRGHGVKYWEIGNEVDLYRDRIAASEYASWFRDFSAAMKAVDPSIHCGAGLTCNTEWLNHVVQSCDDEMDFLVVHKYQNGLTSYVDYRNNAEITNLCLKRAVTAIDTYAATANRPRIKILMTEYSSHSAADDWDTRDNNLFKSLCGFEQLLNSISYDSRLLYMHYWVTHNPWGNRLTVDDADAFDEQNAVLPNARVQQVFAQFAKEKLLNVQRGHGTIRAYASCSPDAQELAVWILNKDSVAQTVTVELNNFSGWVSTNQRWVYRGTDPYDTSPVWESAQPVTLTDARFELNALPTSITAVSFSPASARRQNERSNRVRMPGAHTDSYGETGAYDIRGRRILLDGHEHGAVPSGVCIRCAKSAAMQRICIPR